MAFLDNSGDIILDAVLTDAGRKRMARGEFRIEKFALGDEEINYNLYVKNHASGSAFSDLDIMQTPILEAFTNNSSTMKSKLLSVNRNNILYMPIFRLNSRAHGAGTTGPTSVHALNSGFIVTADNYTTTLNGTVSGAPPMGLFLGDNHTREGTKPFICIDQGIDTNDLVPISNQLDHDLIETAYLIKVDYRLLRVHGMNSNGLDVVDFSAGGNIAFIDDDSIASYYVQSTNQSVVGPRTGTWRHNLDLVADRVNFELATEKEVFKGPVGNRIQLVLRSSMDIQQGSTLFDELGSTVAGATLAFRGNKSITNYKYIDTLVNVTGVTTGQSIDIPVRLIRATAWA